MIFCSACGTQNADSSTFCSNCGKPIAQPAAAGAPSGTVGATTVPGPAPVAGAMPNENVMGGIAYFTIFPAIIFLLIEPHKNNKFVRFHSWQCIWLCIAWFVLGIATFWIPLGGFGVGFLLHSVIRLVLFVAWLIAVINAFQGKMFKLPVLGDLAEQQANKM